MREVLAGEGFVQTYRSFIIHLRKVSFVDKTKEPWTISFFDSKLTAFVSRSYRKELMDAVTPYLDCIAD